MRGLFWVGAKTDKDPRLVKIGGLGRSACVDQHLSRLTAICLCAEPVDPVTKTDKHFAADLPAVQLCRGVRRDGTCVLRTKRVDVVAGHVAVLDWVTKY